MGMDVMGITPTTKIGETFHANVWSWRPIHFLCDYLSMKHNLNFETKKWNYNDGAGLKTHKECNTLADKLEKYLKDHPFLKSDDDVMYVCLNMWVDTTTNQFVKPQGMSVQYPNGTILFSSVVTKAGDVVQSAYSVSRGHLNSFILFLRNCGGFEIY